MGEGVGVSVAEGVAGGSAGGVDVGCVIAVTVGATLASGDAVSPGVALAAAAEGVRDGSGDGLSLPSETGLCTVRGLCCSAISVSPCRGSSAAKSKLFFSPTRSTNVRIAAVRPLL